jgi:hypothetical protein
MPRILKSSFLWQFTGGFMLGALGLFALHPAEAATLVDRAQIHAAK